MKKGKQSKQKFDDDDVDTGIGKDVTPTFLEGTLVDTIKRFSVYVASITKELEAEEKAYIDDRIKKGKKAPKPIWNDSTFKITFVTQLLLKFFDHRRDRLMKYYIIILLPMKPWIDQRLEKFFLEADIFPGAPEEHVKFFRNLWSIDGTMSEKEKNDIWEFWDSQIQIVEDWQTLTGWVINPDEKLNILNLNLEGEAKRLGLEVPKKN